MNETNSVEKNSFFRRIIEYLDCKRIIMTTVTVSKHNVQKVINNVVSNLPKRDITIDIDADWTSESLDDRQAYEESLLSSDGFSLSQAKKILLGNTK